MLSLEYSFLDENMISTEYMHSLAIVGYDIVNVITFCLGIIFLFTSYNVIANGKEDLPLFLLSGIIGLGLLTVAVFPDMFQGVATVIGLEYKGRAILVVSNLTLFVVVTYLFNLIGRQQKKLSRLNEELSLLKSGIEEDSDEQQ